MWWSYQSAASSKARVQREIEKLKKKGQRFEPLEAPAGKKSLCSTFWGQAWCRNLESYQQYENRLPRGRSYLRQGSVYNLEIESGKLGAVVAGSELYETTVYVQPLRPVQWKETVKRCEGQVGSMLDLLAGKLGDGVMQVLSDPEHGLFPKPREIRFDCSCPDYADMCKHVSAVLYGVGVLLDAQPELLFKLRGVDGADLLSQAKDAAVSGVVDGGGELAGADLSALFGIEMGDAAVVPEAEPEPQPAPKAKKSTKSTVAKKAAKRATAAPKATKPRQVTKRTKQAAG